MSFKWKCGCGAPIIVPYKNPKEMNPDAYPYCPKCYKKERDESYKFHKESDQLDFMKEYEQENGDPIWMEPDGTYFYCKYDKSALKDFHKEQEKDAEKIYQEDLLESMAESFDPGDFM
jgi:hypothetical protein